tara:strand:- start:1148 stop:1414 length:267 start_codon:yes stop_codon:yes gene_type:complete
MYDYRAATALIVILILMKIVVGILLFVILKDAGAVTLYTSIHLGMILTTIPLLLLFVGTLMFWWKVLLLRRRRSELVGDIQHTEYLEV